MTSYLTVQSNVIDEARYAEYRDAVIPLIERFGGKHLRSGPVEYSKETREKRGLALGFPSMDALQAFWISPQYTPLKKMRQVAADLTIWAVPGP